MSETAVAKTDEKCCLCPSCGVQTCKQEKSDEYVYVYEPATKSHLKYCGPCGVKLWPNPVRIFFHPGIPKEIQERLGGISILKKLDQWFRAHDAPCYVNVFHRRVSETIEWQRTWNSGDTHPRRPYSYRGYCSSTQIVLLWDETETVESMEWLLYHELGHFSVRKAAMIDSAMDAENKNEGRTHYEWEDDVGHEADAEEKLVNRVATAYMLGKEYSRPWWRPRVNAYLEEKKNKK